MKPFLLVLFCFIFFSHHKISVTGKKENQNKCLTACPKGWEKKGGRCFLWLDPVLSWENTEEICNDEGGHLASVTNLEIHNYIWSKVNPNDYRTFFWIGGTGKDVEGRWSWTDGSAWEFTWWAKQPDSKNDEDCVQIHHGWDNEDDEGDEDDEDDEGDDDDEDDEDDEKDEDGWNDKFCADKFCVQSKSFQR